MGIDKNIRLKTIQTLKNQHLTCGECAGYETEIQKDKKLCKENGVIASTAPCKSFLPNSKSLESLVAEEDTFMSICRLVDMVSDTKLRTLGALVISSNKTRNTGFKMGQKVYVRYRGLANSNYLSNFMSARILYADLDCIRVCSSDGKLSMTFTGTSRNAVLTVAKFKPMQQKMLKLGKYADPDVQQQISKRLRSLEEYELGIAEETNGAVPTIDQVFKANKIKRGVSNANNQDLVSLVRDIEKGYVHKPRKSGLKKKDARNRSMTKKVTEISV